MLAEVTAVFRDVHTGAIYKEGDKIEVTKKRFDEVNQTLPGYLVEVVEEPVELPEEEEKPKKKK